MLPPRKSKWLTAQIGEREVSGEPQLAGEPFKPNVVRTLHFRRPFFGPSQPWLAGDRNTSCALNGFDDPDQLRWPERTAKLQEPRSEINHAEGAGRRSKG